MPFHCMPWFFSGKGWQLTCMQHTRRLTRVQHMKYYSCASYNRAAHEDRSHAAHKTELACSTREIILVSHASLVRVTRQKYKNTRVLPHTSVNLEMSCTVHVYSCKKLVVSQSCTAHTASYGLTYICNVSLNIIICKSLWSYVLLNILYKCTVWSIKTSGSESRPRKVELASAHKKRNDYREYFTHNNEACKNPYKTTLPHWYIH